MSGHDDNGKEEASFRRRAISLSMREDGATKWRLGAAAAAAGPDATAGGTDNNQSINQHQQ